MAEMLKWATEALQGASMGPMAALLCGVSLGKMAIRTGKAEPVIRLVAGALLVCAGFYLLVTF